MSVAKSMRRKELSYGGDVKGIRQELSRYI